MYLTMVMDGIKKITLVPLKMSSFNKINGHPPADGGGGPGIIRSKYFCIAATRHILSSIPPGM